MNSGGLVLILSGFPRRSETFALNEALALAQRGMLTAIFASKPGDGQLPQPGSERLLPLVQYLSAGSPAEQAEEVAKRLVGRGVCAIHAYFAHTPATIAEKVGQQLGVPFGFSTHAKDARKVPPAELGRRSRAAACVIACNPDVAGELKDAGVSVQLLPHGVDTNHFRPAPMPTQPPIQLLAVGRLVEKKGFDVLIHSVAQVAFPLRLRIIGDGPERGKLAALIAAYHLTESVELSASMTHDQLVKAYASAHIVVAPSVVDSNGDRDGLPNVLLEAMACGRPVVASDVAAIGSAITTGETGWLTPPGDSEALAEALTRLAQDETLRASLSRNARQRVEQDFDLARCSNRFCDFLARAYRITQGESPLGAGRQRNSACRELGKEPTREQHQSS